MFINKHLNSFGVIGRKKSCLETCVCGVWITMEPLTLSTYAENLDSVSKSRYVEKLTILKPDGGFFYLPDPYFLKETDWRNDMTVWPTITANDIKKFLTSCAGLNEISMKAYDYVVSGKVQDIKIFVPAILPDVKVLCTNVMPSMKCNDKPYEPWVITHDNIIKSAHCTCIAGLGEVCSHVGALLYKVQFAVVNDLTSASTEKKCEGNSSFTKKIKPPEPLKNIYLSKAPLCDAKGKIVAIPLKAVPPISKEQLNELRRIAPDAVFFTAYSDSDSDSDVSDTDTASSESEKEMD